MRLAHRLACSAILLAACAGDLQEAPDLGPPPQRTEVADAARAAASINPRLLRRFKSVQPVPPGADGAGGEARVALGHKLYFDTRLSRDRDLSCNSCHRLDRYGVDGEPTSIGHKGKRGERNTPSVYNAAGHRAQFWDGRARDVEEQAKLPILNPLEMAMADEKKVVAILESIPGYAVEFARAFPGETRPITYDNVGRAIGAFERRLITRSRWDEFLDGDRTVLSAGEVEGLKIFADAGCVQCHTGEWMGGSMFQKVGSADPWPNQKDQGRFELTHLEVDRMWFKVPSLRNVAKTAPYFHDAAASTLEQAVQMMARHQLGTVLRDAEVGLIVAWLGSLTGELPAQFIQAPELPPDGPSTARLAAR